MTSLWMEMSVPVTSRLASAVPVPTLSPNVTVPVPLALTVRSAPPSKVLTKSMLPLVVVLRSCATPVRDTALL